MILSVHKARADNLDLLVVENDFCSGKEEQWNTFGNFQQKDFPAVKDVSWRYILVTYLCLEKQTFVKEI